MKQKNTNLKFTQGEISLIVSLLSRSPTRPSGNGGTEKEWAKTRSILMEKFRSIDARFPLNELKH